LPISTFDEFLSEQAVLRGFGSGSELPADDFLRHLMFESFSGEVAQALFRSLGRSTELSNLLKEKKAAQYMRFGVGRRLLMMWWAYHHVVTTVPAGRKDPLVSDESQSLTQSMMVVYINIRGVLDNLCWVLLHEHAPEKTKELKPHEVGLFQNCIVKDSRFLSLVQRFSTHKSWNGDVKGRRDPSAHRMPLTIPPQVLTPEEAVRYGALGQKYSEGMKELNLDGANEALNAMEHIGSFAPYFLHDPDDGPIPIYPTLPNDVAHVIQVFNAVDTFLMAVE
jgi:hypothetical protein